MAAKNIREALNSVMKQVGYVQKQSSRNLTYTYAGEAALIAAIRPFFVEEGIIVYPYNVTAVDEVYTTKSGSSMNMVNLLVTYIFHHAPSNTELNVTVRGSGADVGDKATSKAMTMAFKYALRQTLMIETGDDPDETSSASQERKKAAKVEEPKKEEVEEEKLERARSYVVPKELDIPMRGKSFGEIEKDEVVGPLVVLWIAGRTANHAGLMFEPEEEQTALVGAARYVADYSPIFEKSLAVFKEANPELF